MAFIPIDQEAFNDSIQTVTACGPVMFRPDGPDSEPVQKVDKQRKLPLWEVTVAYRHPVDFGPEFMAIRLAAQVEPEVSPGPIRFGGLALKSWEMGSKRGLSWTADTFTQETRPSTKRSTPPAPPAPTGEGVKKAA